MFASESGSMEPVFWDESEGGLPRSARFGEPYRTRSGGLAQAQTVFLQGCGLPDRWRGADEFRILETGFGLGLNFLVTWAAWAADAQRCGCLHYCALEAFPVGPDDLIRSTRQALQPQPDALLAPSSAAAPIADAAAQRLQALALRLAQPWTGCRPGIQTLEFEGPSDGSRVRLTLALGEVLPMLDALGPSAAPGFDAAYLDGFSPVVNPAMWSAAVLGAVARQMRAGARLATYTTAPAVRQGLRKCGFQVERRPGLAPKRHRLEALYLPVQETGSGACPIPDP